ncbi:MAG: hypothetical protein N2260_03445 [Syntrophobacterales bacterium]|nr:hypothetical protein [Syntrophobacterales bacterium]
MNSLNLCTPFDDTSCFRCCPPIRPSGYDHIDYISSLKREFRENRNRISSRKILPRPIVGFWCWALGYIDDHFKTIGCLLHPARNRGVDLRFLTGYGAKCAREICYEAREFLKLSKKSQLFWLELARGLSSFYFSSPRANPLLHLLRWGGSLLEVIRDVADRRFWTATEAVWRLEFLLRADLNPRAWKLPVEIALAVVSDREDVEVFLGSDFFFRLTQLWIDKGYGVSMNYEEMPYVHFLSIDDSLKDFIKFFLGVPKMTLNQALELREILKKIVIECLFEGDEGKKIYHKDLWMQG